MFSKPTDGGLSGPEMMVMNLLRKFGVDPEKVNQLVALLTHGASTAIAQQRYIIAQNTAIMEHLGISAAETDQKLLEIFSDGHGRNPNGVGGSDTGNPAGNPGG